MITVFDIVVVVSAVRAVQALRVLVLILILSVSFLAEAIDKQVTVHCII
jgi:hypothetical protein